MGQAHILPLTLGHVSGYRVVGGIVRALLIALAVPVLNHLFMGFAGFLHLRRLSATWGEAFQAADQEPLNYALVQAASVGLIFIVAFPHRRREGGFLEAVQVRPLLGAIVGVCFLAGIFLQLPLAETGNLVQEIWPVSFEDLARRHQFVSPTTWWGGISALVALVLVAPVTEELLFRGWLLHDLKAQYGEPVALIWSSALFGLAHIEAAAAIYAALGGLVLGAVALRTKSTLSSIAMHAGVNALPLLLPATLIRIDGFNTLSPQVEHISWWLLALSIAAAAGALTLVWRSTADQS